MFLTTQVLDKAEPIGPWTTTTSTIRLVLAFISTEGNYALFLNHRSYRQGQANGFKILYAFNFKATLTLR
jgi:hypothetical protein